jgi:hypothetical protein
LGGVESEGDEKKGTIVFRTFKIGFYFILKPSVEFFFFGVEKLKINTVLSIFYAVIFGGGVTISIFENCTPRRLFRSLGT